MNILVINAADIKGGAAKVGYDLARGLRDRAHEVTYLVGKKFADQDWIQEIPKRKTIKQTDFSQRVIHRLGMNSLSLNSDFPFQLGESFFQQFDLIHLHDLPRFNLLGFPWLTRRVPTVWTLHNQAPFTGNCIYSYECDRWLKSCGECPQFGQWPLLWLHRDGSRLNLFTKRWVYRFSRLCIVGVSDWVSQQAKPSVLGHLPIQTILNGIPTDVYRPLPNKEELRQQLHIPPEAKVILFSVGGNVLDNRKGLDLIIEALSKLQNSNLHRIPLGIASESSEIEAQVAHYPHRPFESVSDPHQLNQLLNVTDVIWHPSRADNLPLMPIEGMAAGVPSIAADVGGVREIITHGETGYLIPPNDADTLTQTTDEFFALPQEKRVQMSKAGRDRAETHFSLERFLDEHELLYRQILSKN